MRIVIQTADADAPARIECRALDIALDADTVDDAARQIQAAAVAEIGALAPIAEKGILMIAGVRRLARLRELEAVVSRLVVPGA